MNHSEAGRLGYIKVEDKLKKAYEAKRERARGTYHSLSNRSAKCVNVTPTQYAER